MNIKRIVRYLELKSQLTTEELQMAETMAGLTESDKEALAGLLQPVKVKGKPTTATKRVIEKCATEGCGLTRRAQIHKDANADGYHVFSDPHGVVKSKRASGMARALNDSLKSRESKEPRCVVCFEIRDHANHDLDNGGHEFTTDLAGRVNEVLDKHNDYDSTLCVHILKGGGACRREADNNIHHMTTDSLYHEFVGGETAVGVGGD